MEALRNEIDQATKLPGITPDDLKQLRDEVLVQVQAKVQSHDKELREEIHSHNPSTPDDSTYNKLKNQAFARRFNIIVFGLMDRNANEEDLKEVQSFFEEKMGLMGLSTTVTYRLGSFIQDSPHPRPLVVKFANIKDKWTVWNHKGSIPYNRESPIRIQEDIPRKMREDVRVLQRIARVGSTNVMVMYGSG